MRKYTLIIFITFFITINSSEAVNTNLNIDNNIVEDTKIEERIDDKEYDNSVELKNKLLNNDLFLDKKILKKELSNRKRYHKNLLYQYNKDFDNKYLELISKNGIIISKLDKYYRKNFI